MVAYRNAFWLNTLSFLLVILLTLYTKLFGSSVGALFFPPFAPAELDIGLLTHTFQILCAVPPIVCAFTFAILKKTQPKSQQIGFILCSGLVTGGFLLNEIFRIHIHLLNIGVPKLITSLVYALIALGYGFAFRKLLKSTPYRLLLTGMGLLFFAIVIDSLKLKGDGLPSLLEGIPKLFSEINIVLYFWYVCYCALVRSLQNS